MNTPISDSEKLPTLPYQLELFPAMRLAPVSAEVADDYTLDATLAQQLGLFPRSRYMGSKQAILPFIYQFTQPLAFSSVLDAFSGSGSVSYLFKAMGKRVTSNDFMRFCYHTAHACVANSHAQLDAPTVEHILSPHPSPSTVIQDTFEGLYFTREENMLLDNMTAHIRELKDPFKKSIAHAAIAWACLRRRPRGLFTYVGMRYDDGRRDLQTSLPDHFRNAVQAFNQSVFDNGQACASHNTNVSELSMDSEFDLVYLDPPYVSPYSDNDYTRRYHFVEGLVRYWDGLEILPNTLTRKFRRFPSLFDSPRTVMDGFAQLFRRYADSIIVVSYSSNGIPDKAQLAQLLSQYKAHVDIYECNHRYSFGNQTRQNQNSVKEYLFIGT